MFIPTRNVNVHYDLLRFLFFLSNTSGINNCIRERYILNQYSIAYYICTYDTFVLHLDTQ